MQVCISQATTLSATFDEDVAGHADGGGTALEVWLTKLEEALKARPAQEIRSELEHRGVRLVAAAYQGGLLLSQGEERQAHLDHYRRRLDLCQFFGIPTLVIVPDFAPRLDAGALQRALVALAQAAQWAAGFDVRLALEFRGQDTFCSCLDTALSLVEECGEQNVGVCLDVFHYYKGPSKPEDLERLTRSNLAHVQLCDVAGLPRELMTDADRIFPGEGDFRLDPIVERLEAIGYDRGVSLELMNPALWKSRPAQVTELGLAAMRRVLEAGSSRDGADNS